MLIGTQILRSASWVGGVEVSPLNPNNYAISSAIDLTNVSGTITLAHSENTDNSPLDNKWSYISTNIYTPRVLSGPSRLGNGNTLITVGTEGQIIEINNQDNIVWSYTIPIDANDVFKCFRHPLDYNAFNNQELPILEDIIN